MDDLELMTRRFHDLAQQADKRGTYTFSPFLNLAEQDLFLKLKNSFAVPASLYAPQKTSERKLAVFGSEAEFGYPPDPPVRVLKISPLSEKFSEDLTHRDYLGAVLNTGIDRSFTGDIIIRGKNAYLFCLESMVGYLKDTLHHIKHTDVMLSEASGSLPELEPEFQELRLNVASERLDAVVAAFLNQSRTKASVYFSRELVFVNSRAVTDTSAHLKEGDVLNVRGFGKAIYDGIDGTSRKGRLYVVLRKYV